MGSQPQSGAPGTSSTPDGQDPSKPRKRGVARRHLIFGSAAAGLGALAGAATLLPGRAEEGGGTPSDTAAGQEGRPHGTGTVPFFGPRQAGIDTDAQAHGNFVALTLRPDLPRARVKALLRLLTDDAARLTQGRGALADTEAELAASPARLTVTFGFGPGLVELVNPGQRPSWLKPLQAFGIDRLRPEFSGGDLLLQICSDDPLTVAHAQRMLLKDARSFATVKWVQQGFRRAHGTERPGTTMRNLFGQVDGTANPVPSSGWHEEVVWGAGSHPAWMENGTSLVIRRIAMNLDTWDELDRSGRDASVGRRMDNGAPLTGTDEFDEPDFEALNPVGFPVIEDFSHMRRARPEDPAQRIFRRAYNYDGAPAAGEISGSGLIFASFQADVERQFTPIQQRLDELDMLNQWTVPIGSAVFAIPPGCEEGGFIGEHLFT
ncbi:peroxidase [Arthrobacter stackebrandtii]|nr:peroxidase [Arthrobacter stackebrandtii]